MKIHHCEIPTIFFIFFILVPLIGDFINCQNLSTNATEIEPLHDKKLSRQKRYLIFPEGSNVQLVYCLTIGAYYKPGELVVGLTAALAWELPSKVDKKFSNLLHRRSRSVFFPKIEAFLDSLRNDGSKFEVPYHQEYDHAHQQEQKCDLLYPMCPYSIYDLNF